MTPSILPSWNPVSLLQSAGFLTRRRFALSDTPSLMGKVAIVTGGQAGIGREMTAQLLLHGISKVYVLARSESRYVDAKAEWVNKDGLSSEDVDTRTEFVQCDLSDIQDVKKVVDLLKKKLDRLDILINNAGKCKPCCSLTVFPTDSGWSRYIQRKRKKTALKKKKNKLTKITHLGLPPTAAYELSQQGIEKIFATNHVGHFILTNLLLPILEQTSTTHGSARIVVTSSSLHMACQQLDLSLLTSPTRTKSPASLDSCWRYARSKLANILFTSELAKRLEKRGATHVYANAFFPGNIPTDAMDTWKELFGTLFGQLVKGSFGLLGQSPEEAAATAIYLATSDEVQLKNLKGQYFVPIAAAQNPSPTAQDKDLAKNLWYWTDNKVSETLGKGWLEESF